MGDVGRLVKNSAGAWITKPPTNCSSGHPLGGHQVLVGHQACQDGPGGHTTWTCLECDETIYGPPLGPNCEMLHGPAKVRSV